MVRKTFIFLLMLTGFCTKVSMRAMEQSGSQRKAIAMLFIKPTAYVPGNSINKNLLYPLLSPKDQTQKFGDDEYIVVSGNDSAFLLNELTEPQGSTLNSLEIEIAKKTPNDSYTFPTRRFVQNSDQCSLENLQTPWMICYLNTHAIGNETPFVAIQKSEIMNKYPLITVQGKNTFTVFYQISETKKDSDKSTCFGIRCGDFAHNKSQDLSLSEQKHTKLNSEQIIDIYELKKESTSPWQSKKVEINFAAQNKFTRHNILERKNLWSYDEIISTITNPTPVPTTPKMSTHTQPIDGSLEKKPSPFPTQSTTSKQMNYIIPAITLTSSLLLCRFLFHRSWIASISIAAVVGAAPWFGLRLLMNKKTQIFQSIPSQPLTT